MAKRKRAGPPIADPVTAYALAVVGSEVVAGPQVRAACARHLADLEQGPARGLSWHPDKALRAIGFFHDVLRLAEGQFAGQPFTLQPFQAFKVGSLFGWLNADGFRRFRMAYIEEGKGSGKSPLAAGIGLYMLTADGEAGAEVYAAAVTRDQAQICFQDAVKMVAASPELTARIEQSGRRAVYNLAHVESGSFFRPLSSEGKSLDGKRPHCVVVDEVHEHQTGIVVEKLSAGTKGRRQALMVMITNSGFNRQSVCYQYHDYSLRVVIAKPGEKDFDDEFFAFICDLDEGDDPFVDESCWPKANPNLGISVTLQYLRKQVREARGMPAKASIVKRLNFCQWVDAENPWIDGEVWRACEVDPPGNPFVGRDVWASLDLSGTRDLTALGLLSEDESEEGTFDAAVEFWTPKETLQERSREDRVPYDAWVDAELITATPGRSVDYAFVAKRLVELQQECNLLGVAFDPYRIKYLERELEELGAEIPLIPHAQGFYKAKGDGTKRDLWMPHSISLFEGLLEKKRIRIRRNHCLTWNAASAVLEQDPKENKIFAKRKSRGRIDGVVALAMAVGLALDGRTEEQVSVYEQVAIDAARARAAQQSEVRA